MERDSWLHKLGLILVVTLFLLYLSNDCVFFLLMLTDHLLVKHVVPYVMKYLFYYADTQYSVQTG